MHKFKRICLLLLAFLLLVACSNQASTIDEINTSICQTESENGEISLVEDEYYYSKEDVAAYIHQYNKLPENYINKKEARELGWEVDEDSDLVIGGDNFANREGLLPEKEGRRYFEADLIEGYSDHRGPSRLVYSNDGLVFYTYDHYNSFERLY